LKIFLNKPSKRKNMEEKQKIEERSQRIIKLFSAAKGKNTKDIPGPIPPFTKWLNGKIREVRRGKLVVEFEVREEMANPTGLLHGGMQCGMMDDTIGMMSATLGYKGFLISIDFHVDYLGKVKVGEKVRVTGEMIREGRNIVHANAQISTLDGKLIATGNSNLLKTGYKPDYVKEIDKEF
jgi:uncharacterized protein (TIGR00369 family)